MLKLDVKAAIALVDHETLFAEVTKNVWYAQYIFEHEHRECPRLYTLMFETEINPIAHVIYEDDKLFRIIYLFCGNDTKTSFHDIVCEFNHDTCTSAPGSHDTYTSAPGNHNKCAQSKMYDIIYNASTEIPIDWKDNLYREIVNYDIDNFNSIFEMASLFIFDNKYKQILPLTDENGIATEELFEKWKLNIK
jgi:hypothetical protein